MCIYMCGCVPVPARMCVCVPIGERWGEIAINNTYRCIKYFEADIISM